MSKTISVADQFYIQHHQDVPVKELAATLGLTERTVTSALRKAKSQTPVAKSDKLKGFDVGKRGAVALSPQQASADDDLRPSPHIVKSRPGLHIINPDKPVT